MGSALDKLGTRTGLVINGGPRPSSNVVDLLPKADLILAVDSGLDNALALGITPNIVIGDLDSISKQGLDFVDENSIQLITYPQDKDSSDLELCLAYAAKSCSSVTIVDSGGGRMDHLFGLFASMASNATIPISCNAFVSNSFVHVVRDHLTVKQTQNNLISIYPFGGDAKGVCLSGFRWDLTHETLSPNSTHGLSNELVSVSGEISLDKGVLLVIQPDFFGI